MMQKQYHGKTNSNILKMDDDDDDEPEHISAGPSSYSGILKNCFLTTCIK